MSHQTSTMQHFKSKITHHTTVAARGAEGEDESVAPPPTSIARGQQGVKEEGAPAGTRTTVHRTALFSRSGNSIAYATTESFFNQPSLGSIENNNNPFQSRGNLSQMPEAPTPNTCTTNTATTCFNPSCQSASSSSGLNHDDPRQLHDHAWTPANFIFVWSFVWISSSRARSLLSSSSLHKLGFACSAKLFTDDNRSSALPSVRLLVPPSLRVFEFEGLIPHVNQNTSAFIHP